MNKKIKILIIIIVALVAIYSIHYMTEYSPAEKTATDMLNGSKNVSITNVSNALFLDGKGNDTALIFYPGAKIEYTSYLPLLMNLAENGVDCYLVEMPLNLALFAQDSANSIIDTTNYSHYIIAGHSLGGVCAANYLNQSNKCDGLVLIASYPTKGIDKPVLSIYGSEDRVMDMETYKNSKSLMNNMTEYVIEGGNHGQYAYYGLQKGDGVAKISPENQQNQCVDKILEFIHNITLSNQQV